MTSVSHLLAFAGLILLGAMSPGPDFAMVVRRSAISGRTHGMAAAAGIAAGVSAWALAAALGVAALFEVAPVAFTVVKVVGAGYLVFLGVGALRAARRPGGPEALPLPGAGRADRLWVPFREGLLCNVLNPKVAVFFVALLPQFFPADAGLTDSLALSAVAVVVTAAWFVAVANLVAAFRRVLARPALRRAVDALTGTVLIGLGVRLALTTAR
ncbi:LysE family translocator [Micromonospora sp. NPDC049497]|uniref:LysE family translocator n=1 Tax=Micromonospora sp. NPDC049497 TaxID=3364273 RepID=UPI0037B02A32